jgi:hypothetical protein
VHVELQQLEDAVDAGDFQRGGLAGAVDRGVGLLDVVVDDEPVVLVRAGSRLFTTTTRRGN